MGGEQQVEVYVQRVPDFSPGNVPIKHSRAKEVEFRLSVLLLRILSAILHVVCSVLMVSDKESEPVAVPGFSSLRIIVTASFKETLALECFVAANAIVAGYSIIQTLRSLIVFISNGSMAGNRVTASLTFFLDQMFAYYFLSSSAAATEVAYIAKEGEEQVAWFSVCDKFSRFCNQIGASLATGYLAFLVLAMLSVISASHLFRSSKSV